MWLLFSLLLSGIACSWTYDGTRGCGIKFTPNDQQPLISSGNVTYRNEYPWHVALYKKTNDSISYICGGTIIHHKAILTAAHCIYDEDHFKVVDNDIFVATGKYYSSWNHFDMGEHRFKVIGKQILPTYLGFENRFADDIAVLALNASIPFSNLVHQVCVDWSGQYEGKEASTLGTVVGWGSNSNQTVSETLQQISLHHFTFTDCRNLVNESQYATLITSDKFCAENDNGSRVETGDSGGGLVLLRNTNATDLRYYIQGVLSTRILDMTERVATFTNVSVHMRWLNGTVKNILTASRIKEICGKRNGTSYTDPFGKSRVYYPWLATIYMERRGKFFAVVCIGNIIHPKAIITNAWCLRGVPAIFLPAKLKVLVGKHDLNMTRQEPTEQRFNISEVFKQDWYKQGGNLRSEQEIAIIIVDDEIKFNEAVWPICIDFEGDMKLYNRTSAVATLVSWNTKECHCQEEAFYKFYTYQQCKAAFNETKEYLLYVASDKLCGTFTNGTEFTRSSDVGGGLMFSNSTKDKDGVHYLYGVACKARSKDAEFITFTNIDVNRGWIQEILESTFF